MSEIVFPIIDDTKCLPFKLIWQLLKTNPEALDHPSCPYNINVKTFLKAAFLAPKRGGLGIVGADDAISDDDLDILPEDTIEELEAVDLKVKRLLARLEMVAGSIGLQDTSEQIQIAKAQSQLYDRLLGLRERVYNVKTIAEAQSRVLDVIERHLTKDQITAVMAELRSAVGEQD